ncbi:V4R domain-containing protein [Leptolyngbya sp. FACHB-261]|uniref:V4R domain-containing protein n=1 Tax=Leptolyngbya sp. FACHB-261 TaxID=2692806 RepID=UPI00168268E6|nr:V4R domain-containing protein [Leptolyngbya sp. FACHB-261]MBD2101160.1 4-vinyl reductase [Leptolyngbya sp. FACHB-261]
MISVADLLKDNRAPGNYFAPASYIRGDLELGILENRRGDRLLALPETLVRSIYVGLERETGQASRLVLFNCGRWWGKNFFARFSEEVSDYYGVSLNEMEMALFLQCLRECWVAHGWGKLDFERSYEQRGFLVLTTTGSPFAEQMQNSTRMSCALEAGILSSFFSQLTGRSLHCVQTSCESIGAPTNHFVVGLKERLAPVEAFLGEGLDHASIMARLCP